MHKYLGESTADRRRRKVPGTEVMPGNVAQDMHHCVALAGEALPQNLPPACDFLDGKISGATADAFPKLSEGPLAGGIMQDRAGRIHKVVAGGAVGAPALRKLFARGQDLLHHDIGAFTGVAVLGQLFKARSQFSTVRVRLGQSVDVIDTHAVDNSRGIEAKNFCVHGFERLFIVHAQGDEAVDVKEAAPIDQIVGRAPPAEPIVLTLKQAVQARAALWAGGVERGKRLPLDVGPVARRYRRNLIEIADDKANVAFAREPDLAGLERLA